MDKYFMMKKLTTSTLIKEMEKQFPIQCRKFKKKYSHLPNRVNHNFMSEIDKVKQSLMLKKVMKKLKEKDFFKAKEINPLT